MLSSDLLKNLIISKIACLALLYFLLRFQLGHPILVLNQKSTLSTFIVDFLNIIDPIV